MYRENKPNICLRYYCQKNVNQTIILLDIIYLIYYVHIAHKYTIFSYRMD